MNKKYCVLGFFLIGILLMSMSFGFTMAMDGEKDEGEEDKDECEEEKDKKDDDCDGIDDDFEEENQREVIIEIGENVVEMISVRQDDEIKDKLVIWVRFDECGIAVQVYFRIEIKIESEETESDEDKETEITIACDDDVVVYELEFEVRFKGLIEYVDLNENGVYDEENDQFIEDYGINSFQPVFYTPLNISDNSTLHYVLLNTTDGIFATHIYFPEEFTYVDDNLITPTQTKIDIEITDFNYVNDSSQLALFTKLRSEETTYDEREETQDEKGGYATKEKEVFIKNDIYTGIFSWKETVMVDGVEMDVLTNYLEVDEEKEHVQHLLINYPRGNHIYHDPKIGISIEQTPQYSDLELSVILTGAAVSVIGVVIIGAVFITGVIIKKRRIR